MNLVLYSKTGEEKIVDILGPGQSFAEAVMFMAGPVYPLSAVTAGPSRIARFSSTEYVSMLRESPETCLRMLGHLSQRLHMRIREIEYLTLESATHRLVRMIETSSARDRRSGGNPVPGVAAGDCFTALHEARDAVAHPPPACRCRRHHRARTDPAGAQPCWTDINSRLRDLTDDSLETRLIRVKAPGSASSYSPS